MRRDGLAKTPCLRLTPVSFFFSRPRAGDRHGLTTHDLFRYANRSKAEIISAPAGSPDRVRRP